MTGEVQLAAAPVAEQQRAERFARALPFRVAADDELRRLRRLDLEPRVGALAGLIRAVLALGDDAFEAAGERGSVELLCIVGRVHQLQMRCGQQALRQIATPIDVRRTAQVDAREMQQVEAQHHDRRFALRGCDLRWRLQLAPVLQMVERRTPRRSVERDDLAVEDHGIDRLGRQVGDELRKRDGQIDASPRLQANGAVLDESDHAIAVDLRLVQPLRVGGRRLVALGEHRVELLRHGFARPGRAQHRGVETLYARARRKLVERSPGQHGTTAREDVAAAAAHEAILVLEEQPLLVGRRSHQCERSFQLLAAQEEVQLAFGQLGADPLLRLLAIAERVAMVLVRRIHAAIPDDDIAGAVLLRGNHALERAVVERMVLDLDREALVAVLQRRPLRHRPGLEHAVELEAEVVMQAARRVLLDHEQQRPAPIGGQLRCRLGCARERPLLGVAFQGTFHAPILACQARA